MRVEELEEVRPSQPAASKGPVGVDFGVVGVGVLEHAEGGPAFGVRILDIEYGTDAQVVVVDPTGDQRGWSRRLVAGRVRRRRLAPLPRSIRAGPAGVNLLRRCR